MLHTVLQIPLIFLGTIEKANCFFVLYNKKKKNR